MPTGNTIQYLKHKEINKKLWDDCIDAAPNGLIYGYSVYLDNMASNWDGLVLNNYEAVMPLPWRKKFGFHYLYQPFLTAQLGLFGNNITATLLQEFLNAIPKQFRLWEFSLNHANLFSIPSFNIYERKNFVFHLNESYQNLYKAYRENIKRNIKRSQQSGCYLKTGIEVNEIINLAKQQERSSTKDFKNFERLYNHFQNKNLGKTYGIYSIKDELIASAVFLFSHNRAYYILVGNHKNGRTLGASHALVDAFIKDYANQNLLLDFEGSDLKNLAFFYSGFGATEETYAAIKWNDLPWYVKWRVASGE